MTIADYLIFLNKIFHRQSLRSISCAAREHNMYVVVNHHERVDCDDDPNCPDDGFLLYNTNVVFDRGGRVVARYRKYNLFNEPGTNVTRTPEISIFETDFGVTFGQFICYDMLQEKPAMYFAGNHNVTDIVYSTHWFAELPFLNAVQEQAAWAYGADVNFLASGYSDALTGSGGKWASSMGSLCLENNIVLDKNHIDINICTYFCRQRYICWQKRPD